LIVVDRQQDTRSWLAPTQSCLPPVGASGRRFEYAAHCHHAAAANVKAHTLTLDAIRRVSSGWQDQYLNGCRRTVSRATDANLSLLRAVQSIGDGVEECLACQHAISMRQHQARGQVEVDRGAAGRG